MRFIPTAVLCACIAPLAVQAQEIFTVSDIRLEGLQRISPASVFGLLNVSVGDQVAPQDIAGIIRSVFSSDYFEDVEVLREDNVLIIRVQERPSISEIEIDGNDLIPTDALLENMEGAGLAVGQIFNRSVLQGMQLALQEQYVGQGLYGATVEVDVEQQERNRVAININIDEGDAAKIVHINIVGNEVFDDEELLELFELRETHFTSFFRKDDRYSREKIDGDLERLRSYYLDQGYINFEITSTQVSISPNRSQVYITVNVDEGDVYTVNEVELAGDLVGSEQLLRAVIQVRGDQVFSQQLVTSSTDFMTQLLSNRGYFFAEVEGIPSINEQDKTVDVTFFVEPGDRTYVNRINFYGNTATVDEVLRREMRQMEGAPASTIALEQSKVRLERLGYFSEVEYETSTVPGSTDQIDVDFSVEEQNFGSITGTIGYAQVQGLVLSGSLEQNNFLGTGNQVSLGVQHSRFSTSYNFSFFDPYYTIDGVSRGFSLYYTTSDWAELGLAAYSTDQVGGTITYGYQINEVQNMRFNFGLANIQIDAGQYAVQEIQSSPTLFPGVDEYIVRPARARSTFDPATGRFQPIQDAITAPISELPPNAFNQDLGFIDREGDNFTNFTLGATWNRSTLNRGVFPTAGSSQSVSFEMSVPGSGLEYYRLRYFGEKYIPIFGNDWVLHASFNLGYGDGYGETGQLPFFQNFYAGGLGSVRGFERNSLGPRSTPPQQYVTAGSELLRDADGNILLNSQGEATLNANSAAYQLVALLDANGNQLVDEQGNPLYRQELAAQYTHYMPRDAAPFGGNIQTVGSLELIFPLPLIEDRSSVRSSFFVDGGNVFSSYCTGRQEQLNNCSGLDFGEFRYSAGIAVSWLNGFAPMTFSVAVPFNASEIDEEETFQFTVGTVF